MKQRLAAILAADAAAYSRHMAVDERATIAALDAGRSVFRNQIESNSGRVVDMAGDSVLAVFETAAGALTAALSIQNELAALTVARPLQFRIGIHLGDVIEKSDGTVYGDGINIAARLQALAEPGAVIVSDALRSALRGKVAAGFEDQGDRQVKNIAEPVRVFRVRPVEQRLSEPSLRAVPSELPLPDKPSIAVLPFTNMSGEAGQEYFADGIAEDIITELSRFGRLFVIARNTTFTFKGRSVDVREVARQLGVHFILEGSVRKAANRVRVTAQLIEGQSGSHVWAERYEDILDDVFDVQERITRQVVGSMVPEIEAQEMRLLDRGPRRFTDADDISWRAWKAMMDSYFKGDGTYAVEAARLAEAAIERDRRCWFAWYVLSVSHAWRVFMGWSENRRQSLEIAGRAADELVLLAPKEGRSYHARGSVILLSGDHERGLADRRKALELNPNDSAIMFFAAWAEAAAGNVERAKTLAAQAIRISPKDIWIGVAHLAYAMAAFVEQNFEELRRWAELAIQSHPSAPIRRVLMIVYAAAVGDTCLLQIHRDRLNSIAPDFVPSLFRGELRPFQKAEHMRLLLDSLRNAGLQN